jgi:hypothetical protein
LFASRSDKEPTKKQTLVRPLFSSFVLWLSSLFFVLFFEIFVIDNMAKSPVIQMQNWFLNNQHQWWCGPPMMSYGHDHSAWFEYTEALQDATG